MVLADVGWRAGVLALRLVLAEIAAFLRGPLAGLCRKCKLMMMMMMICLSVCAQTCGFETSAAGMVTRSTWLRTTSLLALR
jgi:hypothetical protein